MLTKKQKNKTPSQPQLANVSFPPSPALQFLSIEVPQQIKEYLAAIKQHLLDGMCYLIVLQHNGMALQFVNE